MRKYTYLLVLFLVIISCNSQDASLQQAKFDIEKSIEIMQAVFDLNNGAAVYNPATLSNTVTDVDLQKQVGSLDTKTLKEY